MTTPPRSRSAGQHITTPRETALEKSLRLALLRAGEPFVPQCQIGFYRVDFYLPRRGVALEADGSRWHPTAAQAQRSAWSARRYQHGIRRDHFLQSRGLTVVHARDSDIRRNAAAIITRIQQQFRTLS